MILFFGNAPGNLRFQPQVDLTDAQRQAVIEGHALDKDGCCNIRTNQALAFYVKRKMLMVDLMLGRPRWSLMAEEIL